MHAVIREFDCTVRIALDERRDCMRAERNNPDVRIT